MCSKHLSRKREAGFTFLELLIAIFLVLIMVGAVFGTFITILRAFDEQLARSQARAGVNHALHAVVVDLHHAFQIVVDSEQAVRFEVQEQGQKRRYIYYWQGQDGSCPPAFKANVKYDLTRAPLQGGLNGNYTCGSGHIAIRNILPPDQSSITMTGGRIIFNLQVKVKDSQIHVGTSVRARNV